MDGWMFMAHDDFSSPTAQRSSDWHHISTFLTFLYFFFFFFNPHTDFFLLTGATETSWQVISFFAIFKTEMWTFYVTSDAKIFQQHCSEVGWANQWQHLHKSPLLMVPRWVEGVIVIKTLSIKYIKSHLICVRKCVSPPLAGRIFCFNTLTQHVYDK